MWFITNAWRTPGEGFSFKVLWAAPTTPSPPTHPLLGALSAANTVISTASRWFSVVCYIKINIVVGDSLAVTIFENKTEHYKQNIYV